MDAVDANDANVSVVVVAGNNVDVLPVVGRPVVPESKYDAARTVDFSNGCSNDGALDDAVALCPAASREIVPERCWRQG